MYLVPSEFHGEHVNMTKNYFACDAGYSGQYFRAPLLPK